jgi:hypothetical protein
MVSAPVGPSKLHHVGGEHDSLLPVPVLEQGVSHRIILIDNDAAIPTALILHNPLALAILPYQKARRLRLA